MVLGGFIVLVDDVDAADYDQDLGQKWSYSVQFVYTGSNANSIEWDFGDGTVVSSEDSSANWNPMHTYSEKGVYYITQTVGNTNGTTTFVCKIEIMGYPTVTLVHNNGSEDTVTEQSNYGVPAVQPEDPVNGTADFTGWYTDAECTQAYDWSSNVTAPITLYAGWSSETVTHTVSFDSGVSSQTVVDGSTATEPEVPVKDGYVFVQWTLDGQAYDFDTPVTQDISLVAEWTEISSVAQDLGQKWSYTIQFVFTGSNAQSIVWDFGDGSTSTEWNPAHQYAEKGVYYVKQTITNSNADIVTYYKVEVMGFPYITLVYNNGQENGTIQQDAYSVPATQPQDPVYDGNTFEGWFTDAGCTQAYDWSTGITVPITLYAKWSVEIVTHTVTFDSGVASQTIVHGQKATVPTEPTKAGYTFVQWILDGAAYDFDTPVTQDISLVAEWQILTFTVSFDFGVASQTIEYGKKATVPTQPTKAGHTFVQWTLNGSAYDFDTPVTSDISLTAQWQVNTYTVSFDSGVSSQTVEYGQKAVKPSDPSKSGYTFIQWTLNGEAYDFNAPVTGDISLVAQWSKDSDPTTYYRVTFDSDGGSSVSPRYVQKGYTMSAPIKPTKEGHTFDGWYLGDEPFDFNTPITSDITLKAHWKLNEYTVSFDSDVPSQKVQHGQTATEPAEPSKEGHTFDGWYLGDDLYDFGTPVTQDILLTAHWTAVDPGEGPGGSDEPGEDDGEKDLEEAFTRFLIVSFVAVLIGLVAFAIVRL